LREEQRDVVGTVGTKSVHEVNQIQDTQQELRDQVKELSHQVAALMSPSDVGGAKAGRSNSAKKNAKKRGSNVQSKEYGQGSSQGDSGGGGSDDGASQVKCFVCGKFGHFCRKCPLVKRGNE
jgi:hypothetical protein